MKAIRHILSLFILLATTWLLGGCSFSDEWEMQADGGGLQLSLAGISTEVSETRSTPAELGKPKAADFQLNIVRQSNGVTIYNGPFTTQKIKAAPDEYTITATYGTNPLVGVDAPYYIGTGTATVESTTEATPVSLPVAVGNALVSATFNDMERFNRFFDNYAVKVAIGSYSASITYEKPEKSVYVRAGSTVELFFTGYLKALEKQVTMPIVLPEDVSYTLQAAQHLIFTLDLEPNAESAIVTVTKATMEHVEVNEKVSYNWLPAPTVHAEHKYVNGELVGTDISIDASFPGTTWEAEIHQGSATGKVVRFLTGQGALSSTYQENALYPDWPYLPPGKYVATFEYYSQQGQSFNFSKTTEFTIPNANLTLTVDAYTAHSKYEEGNISAANACERLTVYKPSAQWNIAASLFSNDNYTKTFNYSVGNQSFTVDATQQKMTFDNITNVPVSRTLYTYMVNGNFAGQSVYASKQLRITGLPYSIDFTSHSEWSEDGKITWNSDNVQLGNLSTGDQSMTNNSSINLPVGTKFSGIYNVNVHCAAIGTTLSIKVGNQTLLRFEEGNGTPIFGTDHPYSDTTDTFTAEGNITSITCTNSYGAGGTCSYIYGLTIRYGQ